MCLTRREGGFLLATVSLQQEKRSLACEPALSARGSLDDDEKCFDERTKRETGTRAGRALEITGSLFFNPLYD